MIPLYCPTINRQDMTAVLECMVNEKLTAGEVTRDLIRLGADHLGCAGGIALRDKRTALDILFEVVLFHANAINVTPFSDISTLQMARPHHLKVRLIPVNEQAFPIAEKTQESEVLFLHSPLGWLPNASEHKAKIVIEDVGEGLGGRWDVAAGSTGDYVLISLEACNIITSGGGALLLARSPSRLRQLTTVARRLPQDSLLSDINAALARAQLLRIEEFTRRRRTLYHKYCRALSGHATLREPQALKSVLSAFPVVVSGNTSEIIAYGRTHNIEIQPAFSKAIIASDIASGSAAHLNGIEDGIKDGMKDMEDSAVAIARAIAHRTLAVPLYPSLTSDEILQIERVLHTLP